MGSAAGSGLTFRAVAGLALALAVPTQSPRAADPPVVRSQLVWLDRTGKRIGVLGNMADYGNVELSPDDKKLAVAVLDSQGVTRHLWLYDTASGRKAQLSSNPADENWLVWSSDGRRVVFNSGRNGGLDLYQAAASREAGDKAILVDAVPKWPVSWSADGRFLLYVTNSRTTGNDIWVLPFVGDRKPFPLLQTQAAENWAAFSADGRWVAYSSTETGQAEVYIQSFPSSGRRWLASTEGGSQARWRRDGSELLYLALDGTLMSVAVTRQGSDLQIGVARPLFRIKYPWGQYHAYAVTADGQRFLVNSLVLSPGSPAVVAH